MSEIYLRQIPITGEDGQRRLERSTVAVIGLGGLGCNVITHLASAGVGNFIIADNQSPDLGNLNRQFVYSADDTGKRKTERSAEWIRRINPRSNVTELDMEVNDSNMYKTSNCDIIIDCLDNRRSRMIVNRYALQNNIDLVHGGVESLYGQVTVVIPNKTPCLECILPDPIVNEIPSISPMVGIIGSIQALEAVKILSGKHSSLSGKLLSIDASLNSYNVFDIKKKDGCGSCAAKPL